MFILLLLLLLLFCVATRNGTQHNTRAKSRFATNLVSLRQWSVVRGGRLLFSSLLLLVVRSDIDGRRWSSRVLCFLPPVFIFFIWPLLLSASFRSCSALSSSSSSCWPFFYVPTLWSDERLEEAAAAADQCRL